MNVKKPNVGVGIFIFNTIGDKFLIGKRKRENLFGLPGGTLENFESFEECAKREINEETNVLILEESRIKYLGCFNCIKKEINYHWVIVYMKVNLNSEEELQVKNLELDKCEDWIWVTFEEMISMWDELFYPLQTFVNFFNIKSIEDLKKIK